MALKMRVNVQVCISNSQLDMTPVPFSIPFLEL